MTAPDTTTHADRAASVVRERMRVTRHGLLYIFGALAQGGIGFLLLPFATRILGVTQFGVIAAALAVAAVLTALFPLGLNNAIVRLFYDESPAARRAEWSGLLVVQVAISLLLAAVVLATGPLWGTAFPGVGWSAPLQLAVLYALALGIQDTAAGILRASQRPRAFVSVILTQTILGGGLALALAAHGGATGYMTGLCIGAGVSATTALVLSARRPHFRASAITAGLLLSFPFLFHSLSNWVLNLSDRIVIDADLGVDKLAQYQLAYVIASVAFILFEGMQSAWAPFYFSLSDEHKHALPRSMHAPATVAAAGFGFVLAAAAPLIVAIAAPATFGRDYVLIALVAATVCVRPTYLLGIAVLLDRKRSVLIAVASVSAALFNLGLNLLLVPVLGVDAAAAATLAAYGLQALIVHQAVYAHDGQRPRIVALLAGWALATAAVVGVALLPTSAAGWGARGLLSALACAMTLRALRVVRARFVENRLAATLLPR